MNTTTQDVRTTTLAIDGMTCGHCVLAVTKALSVVPGVQVKSVAVGSAEIKGDGSAAGRAVAALDEAGYPAEALGDAVASSATRPAKSGGCCGGARGAAASIAPGAKASGGCCG